MSDYTQGKLEYDRQRRGFTQRELDRMVEHKTPLDKLRQEPPLLLPMSGRIVVEAITEEMSPSGLYLPNAATEQRATIGRIIALPPRELEYTPIADMDGVSYHESPPPFVEGDVVLFGQNSGMLIDLGFGAARRRAIILRESEVLCKVVQPDGSPYA